MSITFLVQNCREFRERQGMSEFRKISELLSIATYYDDEDRETYGLVQFTDASHDSTWTYAINLLYYVTKDSILTVRDMFFALLDTTFGHRTGNQIYSLSYFYARRLPVSR